MTFTSLLHTACAFAFGYSDVPFCSTSHTLFDVCGHDANQTTESSDHVMGSWYRHLCTSQYAFGSVAIS